MPIHAVRAAAAAILLIGASGVVRAATVDFHADLSASNEVPPTGTGGTGHLTASYDSMTKELSYRVEYKDLTGPASAAHFHAPAPKGKNADVAVPITGALASPIEGKTTLTDAQAQALNDGAVYFNIHTAAHKPGEIRGQVEQGR